MTKIIEINNKIQAISKAFHLRVEGRSELYRKADREIFHSAKKVVYSNLKYVMQLPQYADYDLTGVDEAIKQVAIEGRNLASYHHANQFVWLKRHLRIVRKYTRMHNDFIKDFDGWTNALDPLITEIKYLVPSKAKRMLNRKIAELQADIFSEWYGGGEIEPYEPIEGGTWIDVLIHGEFKITKHTALQLLTLEHDDLYTLQQVAAVPDELDQKGFEELVFLARAEADSECFYFDMYMERMMKALEASKELREKTRKGFTEIFGPVPTYNVLTDGHGNVVSMKQNKPNLNVITND